MSTSEPPKLDFGSPEEFQQVCHYLAMRMHYLNRVAMGESGFAWITAEMLKRLGRSFADGYKDPEVKAAFGDGYSQGTVSRDERPAALLARLYPER